LHYAALVARIDCPDDDPALPRWAQHSRAAARLVESYDVVAPALGVRLTRMLMLKCGVPLITIYKLARRRPSAKGD
jgi:hypothetical protein